MGEHVSPGKPFEISKQEVWLAYRKVAANKGAAGVDEVGLTQFESDLKGNLYKIWNRMSSGSYFPPPVKAVEIPKAHGAGTRMLGIPTIGDRIAQTVVAARLEVAVEPKLGSILTPTGTGPGEAPWLPWRNAGNGAGSTTGSLTWTCRSSLTLFPGNALSRPSRPIPPCPG